MAVNAERHRSAIRRTAQQSSRAVQQAAHVS
jgi:hypothetical protein